MFPEGKVCAADRGAPGLNPLWAALGVIGRMVAHSDNPV